MSTTYDLHCKTCDVGCGFSAPSYQIDALVDLWKQRAAVVALTPTGVEMSLMGDYNGGIHRLVAFAAVHEGHDVRVIDGYGIYMQQCRERVACAACGHTHNCVADHGHAGPHQPPVSR